MKRISFVMNIPSPYRLHTFNALWKACKERGIDLHVHFMARGHKNRPKSWLNPKIDFPHTYWKDCGFRTHHFNPALLVYLWWKKVDVLVVGSPYDTVTGIIAGVFARAGNKGCWVEGQTKTPGKMGGFVGWLKRYVLSHFRFVAVPGRDAGAYIALHAARTDRKMPEPVMFPNLIDESRFMPRKAWPSNDVKYMREQTFHASDKDRVCLIPARLEEVKGLIPFLEALDSQLVNAGWRIVIMGQGSLRARIENVAIEKGIGERIVILDYIPYDQMPLCYAAADLMLLPSLHDPNPLSVPEALHSGLPVALSDRCGNVEEGVVDGKNGWVLPVVEHDAYCRVLTAVFSSSLSCLQEMGMCSSEVNAKFWSTSAAIEDFLKNVI